MLLSSATRRVPDAAAAQELVIQQGWSDGLPVIPPTPELVERFVAASGRQPGEVLGTVPEQARTLTVEKVAVNAVMAGCRPEYMSVLLAAVRAISAEQFNLHSTTVSGATAPLVIISGPTVTQLSVNTSFSVFGPGHVANATIGRAVRLVLQNLCGGTPGLIDKSTMGHPGKFSYCIGEDVARNPWQPLHVDRGLPPEASAVTVFAGEAPIFARNDWSPEPGPILATIADAMLVSHYSGGGFVVVLGPLHAAALARAGMSKAAVREALHARARRSVADLKRAGRLAGEPTRDDEVTLRGAVPSPADILVVVAGGHLYGYSAVIPPWVGGHESVAVTEALAPDEVAACRTSVEEACLA